MRFARVVGRRTLASVVSAVLPMAALLNGAELPIKQVTLYKHGIGFFEREGSIPAGDEARLDFRNTDMNDILKSLTVNDSSGKRVLGIRYDSNESLQQRLDKYPFALKQDELISSFLDHLKGASLELKAADRTVIGTILGARVIRSGGSDATPGAVHEQITLLLGGAEIVSYDLSSIASMRFRDSRLQNQLAQYLATLNDVRSRDRRSVYIDSAPGTARNLHVAYVSPTAIWKSSYRLSLTPQNTTLEGWAIVDNTTDEDWNGVHLSVVSGRPISFISQLDTPRYGQRQVAELPEDRAAGPVVYGGSIEGQAGRVGGGVVGGLGRADATAKALSNRTPGAPPPAQAQDAMGPRRTEASDLSTVQGASGSQLGELFEYNFAGPVTIKHSQSAMLPFLQDRIAARKLLICSDTASEHPVNAVEVTNNTAKTLDGGPLTVYDGGAYAGEALVETLKAGDKRLIGYAVDYGTRVTTAFDSSRQAVRELHVQNGVLRLRYAQHQTRTYTIKNVDTKPKTLIVQQEAAEGFSILSPKPSERTATAYRFEVSVPANGSQLLKVEDEHVYDDTVEVMSSTPDFLLSLVENKQLTEAGRKRLDGILAIKRKQVQTEADLHTAETQLHELTSDQTRLRQNIDSLNRVSGQEEQVRRYSSQLAANEVQIANIRDRQRSLTQMKTSLDTELRSAIDDLKF
jgi:hypothetical protein